MDRKPIPDLLKGIAVIFMIQVHIMELFMLPDVYEGMPGKLSLFLGSIPAAPVFMVVMGYFAVRSKRSIKQQMWRGIKLIALGLVLNLGLNAHLLILFIQDKIVIDPFAYIFGADILFLAGFSLIFISVLRYFAGKQVWIFLAFTILVPLVAEYTPYFYMEDGIRKYIMAFFISNAEWSYFPFFPWAGWVLAGCSFALLEEKYSDRALFVKYGTYLLYFAAVPVFVLLPWSLEITSFLPAYYHHGLLFFIWGLFFCLIWIQAWKLLHDINPGAGLFQYLKWLGRNVTTAYVIQWLIIGNIATAIYRSQPMYVFWISLLLIIGLTSLFTRLVLPVLSSGNMPLK